MGLKTFEELKAGLVVRIQNRTDVTDDKQGECINLAYDHVTRPNIYMHRELQATQDITLSATTTYPLDDDVDVIRSVYNVTKGQRLNPRDIEQFDARIATTSRPSEWADYAGNLVLNSTPDGGSIGDTVRIRHWAYVEPLAAAADLTIIHARWDNIIITGAEYYLWLDLGNIERKAEAGDTFIRLIREVPQREQITGKGRGFKAYPKVMGYQKQ